MKLEKHWTSRQKHAEEISLGQSLGPHSEHYRCDPAHSLILQDIQGFVEGARGVFASILGEKNGGGGRGGGGLVIVSERKFNFIFPPTTW